MRIVICASIEFTYEIKKIANELEKFGHEVEIPSHSQKILNGELSLEEFKKVKQKDGDFSFRIKAEEDLIRRYFNLIKDSDAVLVLNVDKNDIKNYVGGNTFLEMGFAHVLNKKIYLYKAIPEISYKDEILAMQPVIINKDLSKIK